MTGDQIEWLLSQVGAELEALGVSEETPISGLLIGGAYMATQFPQHIYDRATEDVDMHIRPHTDENPELYRLFRNALHFVAHDHGLPASWFSDNIGDFLEIAGLPPLQKQVLWRRYGPFFIYLPPIEYIFALKVISGREKDEDDIRVLIEHLQIKTRKQAKKILDTFIAKNIQHDHQAFQLLDDLFS